MMPSRDIAFAAVELPDSEERRELVTEMAQWLRLAAEGKGK